MSSKGLLTKVPKYQIIFRVLNSKIAHPFILAMDNKKKFRGIDVKFYFDIDKNIVRKKILNDKLLLHFAFYISTSKIYDFLK